MQLFCFTKLADNLLSYFYTLKSFYYKVIGRDIVLSYFYILDTLVCVCLSVYAAHCQWQFIIYERRRGAQKMKN